MDRDHWKNLVARLVNLPYQIGLILPESPVHRIEFEAGLSDAEVAAVERKFRFRFPPDLRSFLQTALPCSAGFPDWRSGDDVALQELLNSPAEGVLFDIQHDGFWIDEWGRRPASAEETLAVARDLIARAPTLIPIFGHRMMPDEPHSPGNPVLSVHQTDIICYGFDLTDYLCHEFGLPRDPRPDKLKLVRFWGPDRFQQCSD